jgi:hypothetical protein
VPDIRRRLLAQRKRRTKRTYWIDAKSEVARLYKSGINLPIHFDIRYCASGYSKIERYSVNGIEAMPDCGNEGIPMSPGTWIVRRWNIITRLKSVTAHFMVGD